MNIFLPSVLQENKDRYTLSGEKSIASGPLDLKKQTTFAGTRCQRSTFTVSSFTFSIYNIP